MVDVVHPVRAYACKPPGYSFALYAVWVVGCGLWVMWVVWVRGRFGYMWLFTFILYYIINIPHLNDPQTCPLWVDPRPTMRFVGCRFWVACYSEGTERPRNASTSGAMITLRRSAIPMSISKEAAIWDIECPDCGAWPHQDHQAGCGSPETSAFHDGNLDDAFHDGNLDDAFHDGNLDDAFFEKSEVYARIKAWADENFCNPTAVLHIVLTRIAGAVHPETIIERIPRAAPETRLSLYTAILGRPGDGKSKAGNVARDLVDLPDTCGTINPGSGAGLATCFAVKKGEVGKESGMAPPPTPAEYNGLALFVDEGEGLFATASRQGEDLTPMLCSAFVSEDLSKSLASDSREVKPGTYTLGMAVGMQPQVLNKLAGTQGIGLLQRFLFAPATPKQQEVFDPDGWKRDAPTRPASIPLTVGVNLPVIMQREDSVTAELYMMIVKRSEREERADIDCHHPMVLHKVAGLLALMHGERVISNQHLMDAIDILDASMDYRDQWLDDIESGDDVKREMDEALNWVVGKCSEAPKTRRQLTNGYPKRFRKIYKAAEAVDTAASNGLVFLGEDKLYKVGVK